MLLLRNTGCFALFFAVHVCIISGIEPEVNHFLPLFCCISATKTKNCLFFKQISVILHLPCLPHVALPRWTIAIA